MPAFRACLHHTQITPSLWILSYITILAQMPNPNPVLLDLSLLYLVYYFALSFYFFGKMLRARRLRVN